MSEEKNHAHTLNELNKSVEATRAHLQRELRTKEMENNRLHVQLKVYDSLERYCSRSVLLKKCELPVLKVINGRTKPCFIIFLNRGNKFGPFDSVPMATLRFELL